MSLVLSWTLFLTISLVIYCDWGFSWSGHQDQAGRVIWWLPCGQELTAPVALAWALPASSQHASACFGLADHLHWAQSTAAFMNSNENDPWPSSSTATRAPVHVQDLLRRHHSFPPAPWRSWELSVHKYSTQHNLLYSGWINKTVLLVSLSLSHCSCPPVLCSELSLPWNLPCEAGDNSLGFHLPLFRNSHAVVIMCLSAESVSNLVNLISLKFCEVARFKVCNVNIFSFPFLDFL